MVKKIKVVLFVTTLEGGGAERFIANLANSLDKKKFDVIVVCKLDKKSYRLDNGVKFFALLPSFSLLVQKYYWFARFFFGNLGSRFVARSVGSGGRSELPYKVTLLTKLSVWLFSFLLKREKPDLVFSALRSSNLTSILSAKNFSHPIIVSERIFPFDENVYPAAPILGFYKFADCVVVNSVETKKFFHSKFGLPAQKITCIYNPVDVRKIIIRSRENVSHKWFLQKNIPVVVAVGRLDNVKGFDVLLNAFVLVKKIVDYRLVVLGKGSEKKSLVELAKNLGISGSVEFLGWQDNPFKFVAKADVFVLSSRYEGLPNVLLEAMALGKACVSTDCRSGPKEIITNNVNGLLVPVDDEKKLAKAIIRVLTDKKLKAKLEKNAKKRAKNFDSKKIIKQFEKLFIETINKKKKLNN